MHLPINVLINSLFWFQDHFFSPVQGKIPATGYIQERLLNLQRKLSKQQGGYASYV